MSDKQYLSADQLLADSFHLAERVVSSGYQPTMIIAIWRGGSTVGIYVQECLQYLGVKTDHIAIRTSYRGQPSYGEMIENPESIRVHGLQYLFENLNRGKGIHAAGAAGNNNKVGYEDPVDQACII